jgi:hypothetical protein
MIPTIRSLPKPALPVLSALLLSLFTTPAPAQGPAAGRAIERITPMVATVVSTAKYQTSLTLICSGITCRGEFPAIGNKKRLNLTRVSCFLHSAEYSTYAHGKIDLRTAGNVSSLAQLLPADYSTQWGYHLLNHATDVTVPATQQFIVQLTVAPGGQAYDATCTAHGTLETLQ